LNLNTSLKFVQGSIGIGKAAGPRIVKTGKKGFYWGPSEAAALANVVSMQEKRDADPEYHAKEYQTQKASILTKSDGKYATPHQQKSGEFADAHDGKTEAEYHKTALRNLTGGACNNLPQFAIAKKRVSSALTYAQTDDGAQSSHVQDASEDTAANSACEDDTGIFYQRGSQGCDGSQQSTVNAKVRSRKTEQITSGKRHCGMINFGGELPSSNKRKTQAQRQPDGIATRALQLKENPIRASLAGSCRCRQSPH
jgi:hypothetical protein